MKIYETAGDVRASVDTALSAHNLHTADASFYPRTQGLIFGVVDTEGDRKGDALCLLPRGGWLTGAYDPNLSGHPTNTTDQLYLRTVQGAGKLIVGALAYSIKESSRIRLNSSANDAVVYGVVNPGDDLMIVHARSTEYPANPNDFSPSGREAIDDTSLLASDTIYHYEHTSFKI
jgi:hypothetical protein